MFRRPMERLVAGSRGRSLRLRGSVRLVCGWSRFAGARCRMRPQRRRGLAVRRNAHLFDPAYDNPVIPGGVLGHDLAFERGEGIGEQRYAPASGIPVEAGEPIRSGGGRVYCEFLVLAAEHVDPEAPRPAHPGPRERAARWAE
jgi:hypothetical protein